jgi:hypothetical protein
MILTETVGAFSRSLRVTEGALTSRHLARAIPNHLKGGSMDYTGFIKSFDLPQGYAAPTDLRYDDIVARAISRADLQNDVEGIYASLEIIQRTRGGRWPTGPVTEDFNYADLVWHEVEFRNGDSFTYAAYDTRSRYLGCCYLYPMGRRTPLSEESLDRDVDVS